MTSPVSRAILFLSLCVLEVLEISGIASTTPSMLSVLPRGSIIYVRVLMLDLAGFHSAGRESNTMEAQELQGPNRNNDHCIDSLPYQKKQTPVNSPNNPPVTGPLYKNSAKPSIARSCLFSRVDSEEAPKRTERLQAPEHDQYDMPERTIDMKVHSAMNTCRADNEQVQYVMSCQFVQEGKNRESNEGRVKNHGDSGRQKAYTLNEGSLTGKLLILGRDGVTQKLGLRLVKSQAQARCGLGSGPGLYTGCICSGEDGEGMGKKAAIGLLSTE
ncbi:hypothetical protein ARMSODRAFT_982371 [Armillaria solidipes]|uniref:Uncharacterized protein n=1 Tax=Armillaria solidipes TaxID=1076256 RepID=A0A2H3ARX9_9AGAR|nr:hypothetical protein ARMSODRAFT_982371 [Armillaria solidipes]